MKLRIIHILLGALLVSAISCRKKAQPPMLDVKEAIETPQIEKNVEVYEVKDSIEEEVKRFIDSLSVYREYAAIPFFEPDGYEITVMNHKIEGVWTGDSARIINPTEDIALLFAFFLENRFADYTEGVYEIFTKYAYGHPEIFDISLLFLKAIEDDDCKDVLDNMISAIAFETKYGVDSVTDPDDNNSVLNAIKKRFPKFIALCDSLNASIVVIDGVFCIQGSKIYNIIREAECQ
ncbi:MAG: hypothetical protein NC418_11315 [Muribaculaceae bacterium]|nr:hypothetical protein [Muribaculaceae bacterium]